MGMLAKWDEKNNIIDIIEGNVENIDNFIQDRFEKLKKDNGVTDDIIKEIIDKSEEERTPEENLKLVVRSRIKNQIEEERKRYKDYMPLVDKRVFGETPYGYLNRPKYHIEDGKVICTNELYLDYYFVEKEIKRVKKELSDTDYIIIKSYEAELLGEERPYSDEYLKEVASKRSNMREQINQMQIILDKRSENEGNALDKES